MDRGTPIHRPTPAPSRAYGLTTIVNITLIQEGDTISVRSDALGRDEQVLAIGMQIVAYLSMLEGQNPGHFLVDMPTLSAGAH